ncbi:MAG: hypothetical protein P9L96_03320 [Candidatus Gygaella obscura]|nr:hypothetical protein [Candidatus Gygaella obscura]
MQIFIDVKQNLKINDSEYRLNELVYILHQVDVRFLNSLLKKAGKKIINQVQNESCYLSAS